MNNISDPAPFVPVLKTSCIMHKCILKNDLESLKHMLSDSRRDCINDLDHSGRTPFHVALQCANPKALYLLLYYPLIHPSKIFATLDWTDRLDDVLSSSSSDGAPSPNSKGTFNAGYSDKHGDDSSTVDNKSDLSTDHTCDGRRILQNNLKTSRLSGKSCKLGNILLEHWDEVPKAYLRSALSLETGNYIHGCGLREVEDLYEEHFKFLVGESHTLERAAREYTAKYSRLYSNHPANLERIKEILSKYNDVPLNSSNLDESHLTCSRNFTSDANLVDSKDVGTDQHTSGENTRTISEPDAPYSGVQQKLDVTEPNNSENNLSTESGDVTSNNENIKQMLPLVTVDLIATFDKTAPLHLLFSNAYISSYRKNMLKCFRILVGYFNKTANFDQIFNSCDYNICTNDQEFESLPSHLRNKADLDLGSKYPQSLQKFGLQLPYDDLIVSNNSKECNVSEKSPQLIENVDLDNEPTTYVSNSQFGQDSLKRSLPLPTDDLVVKNRKNTSHPTLGIPWPNNTLCTEASVLSQKKKNVSFLHRDIDGFPGDSSHQPEDKSEFDPRMIILHGAISDSSLWLKTYVSWETFIQKRDFTRSTILHKVCGTNDLQLIKLILFYGFSPLVVNEAGDMPVHLAIEKNNPFCLLTVLHSTFKSLFYSNFNLNDSLFDCFSSDAIPFCGQNRNSGNHFFNMFMKGFCSNVNKTHAIQSSEHNGFLSAFDDSVMDDLNLRVDPHEENFCAIFNNLDTENKRVLFNEMLLLIEQLTYRAIRFSSWESLAAMFSYNSAITYHTLSSPSLMHRFINMAAFMNNQKEFLDVIDFIIKSVLGFSVPNITRFPHSELNDKEVLHKKITLPDMQGINNTYKGCGIPHSKPRNLAYINNFRGPLSVRTNRPSTLSDVLSRFKNLETFRNAVETKKTWIITHPTCLHHLATPEPTDAPNKRHRLIVTYPENPTRLEAIISNDNGILRSDTLKNVKLVHSPPPAALADILRVHDWAYVDKLLEQVQIAQKRWVTHPYWPVLADGDTPVTPHSWSAALYAAGSVISAVDAVCTNACKNAFCAVRPPGHHLGTWGGAQSSNFEDEDFAAGSQGFCLINNVAIGAAYAKYTYAEKGIRRIAIVDFDVHHGNGTEQIIRNIGPKIVKRLIPPYPGHDFSDQSFEPQYSIHKHWFGWRDQKDREEVFFASIHAYDGVFYPGTGKQCTKYDDPSSPRIINVAVPQGTTSSEFRLLFEKNICPYLYHFKPDLIFISAGFDGHYRDSVSYGFTRYTEKDFYYITERLVTIANSVCEGRIISVLEGGYNTKLGTLSPFARSVFEHVNALCHTNSKAMYPYMHGQNSIDLLLSPVVHHEILRDTDAPKPLTPDPEIDKGVLKRVYKLRMKTEMLISKVYSLKDFKHCNLNRFYKFDSTKMCSKAALERHGNVLLSFYSKYFYSLYNVALSLFFTFPPFPEFSDLEDLNRIVEGDDFLPLLDNTLSDMFIGDSLTSSEDQNIDDILINIKAHKDNSEINNLLLSSKWFRDVKTKSLEQNYIVAELLYSYFVKYASVFTRPCILHS